MLLMGVESNTSHMLPKYSKQISYI